MNKKIYIIFLSLIILFTVGCSKDTQKKPEDKVEIPEDKGESPIVIENDPIKDKIRKMTLEEKIGQLLIVGLDGESIDDNTRELIQTYKVGGFILFSRNIVDVNQTLKLLNDLKDLNSENDIPLFLSVDEEGGLVTRLSKIYTRIPEAVKVGNKNDKEISFEFGELLGLRLKSLGFNLDFAPVLDVNSNPDNPVIGSRAFGSNVDVVMNNGIEVMKGIQSTNVIPSVKHFPGHGDTSVDSHIQLPLVEKSLEELESLELIPFKKAIDEGADMVMVAHILYTELDSEYPSTMSYRIMTELLREKLGFNGVIISDDMTMGAIIENYTLEEGVIRFLEGGGDIASICHGRENPMLVINKIKEAIDNGTITMEELNEKVYRILKLKNKYSLNNDIIESIDIEEINRLTKELNSKINE